jgi:REP element-mobilizing transposase RayT
VIGFDTYATCRHLPHLQRPGKTYFVTPVTINREVLSPQARSIILEACLRDHERTYWLHVVVVMPEHAHLIFTPYDDWSLSKIMQRLKGSSAHYINKAQDRRGPLWLSESFDHILRSDESLSKKVEYVRQNPVRRGLVTRPEDYPWLWPRSDETR